MSTLYLTLRRRIDEVTKWAPLGTDTMRSAREAKGWSYETVARQIHVSSKTYERWEKRGEVPTVALDGVAEALGLEVERAERSVIQLDAVRGEAGEDQVDRMLVRVADQLAKQSRLLERLDATETRLDSLLQRVETAVAQLERAAARRPA